MKSSTNKILVPLDFSEQSLIGLDQAYKVAKISNAEIILLHVIVESRPLWGLFSSDEKESFTEKLKEKLVSYAEVTSRTHGVKVSTVVENGKIVDKTIEIAERERVKFIIMGTTSADNLTKKVIGTYAFRVVREAKCPVITIKGKHNRPCRNIILPLDLTKETEEKVEKAIYLAQYFKSKIWAMSVVSGKSKTERLSEKLLKVEQKIKSNRVECTAELIRDSKSISKAILKYSDKVQGDLIMIMTQQENEMVDYFIGSSAKEIINKSEVPVMSIVPQKKQ